MSVIVLSTGDNPHTIAIQGILERENVPVFLLDFQQIVNDPPTVQLGFDSDHPLNFHLENSILREVSGIFVHHPRLTADAERGVDEIDRSLWRFAWHNLIDWLEGTFQDSVWVNRPSNSRAASPTIRQLETASQVGFLVPPTIFTNSLVHLSKFSVGSHAILLKSGPVPGAVPDQHRILARKIDISTISDTVLSASPCLFQRYIEKDYELRVHVVGDEIYSCKIESQTNEHTKVDWRNYDLANTPHRAIELPSTLKKQCFELVKRLGLNLGILDLIVTPEGSVYFLECNSQGSWFWIEQLTGLPISEAVAGLLTGRLPDQSKMTAARGEK